jgi:hypothetical protein
VDPAVGSGAFPMGILNRLVFILSKLDPDNELWKEAQIDAVKNSITDPTLRRKLMDQIDEQFINKNFDYGRKLYLIQKCIYGVDIQQIAVEIAKLRFFIALLVDEKIDKSQENWGIEPLPNLDFKIMQGNSLISEFMGIDFDDGDIEKDNGQIFSDHQEVDELIGKFQQKKNEFQNEPERNIKGKLNQEIDDLMIQIFETKLKEQKADYFSKVERIEEKYAALPNKRERDEIIAKEKQVLSKREGFDLEKFESQLREFSGKNKVKPFFAWKLYFAEVFQGDNPGFDIVIANPPYGADISKNNLNIIRKKLSDTINANSAAVFIDFAKNNWLNIKGFLTYIVPKSLLYAERWFDLVEVILPNTSFVVDVEKAFENVKLEQVVFLFGRTINMSDYTAKKFLNDKFVRLTKIKKSIVSDYKAWICDVTESELKIANNINSHPYIEYLSNISETKRGVGLQKYLKPKGEIPVLGGKNIFRYGIKGIKGYLSTNDTSGNKNKIKFLQQPKIISQNIVAHIQQPYPRLQIIASYDDVGKVLSLDTVNNTVINEGYDCKYILALMNSSLVSWYAYRFIYCSAIRTMHFDSHYVGKIPVIKLTKDEQKPFILFINSTN